MSRTSQRHRQEINGLDSSGRPPEAGGRGDVSTPGAAIGIATGDLFYPADISFTGIFVGTETVDVDLTDDNTGAQSTGPVACPAGGAGASATAIAVAINLLSDVVATANGGRVEVRAVSPATTVTLDLVTLA